MSIASHPDERSDALEVYLGRGASRALSLAVPSGAPQVGGVLERATSAVLRGGLTSWVHVGMMVRRLRGRADPLQGLGRRDTFQALCRLVEAALEARPLAGDVTSLNHHAHLRMLTTELPAAAAMDAIEQVLKPYAAAGSITRSGRAVIGWFAIRHLIVSRSAAFSLQIVHLTPAQPGAYQVSLMLPRGDGEDDDRAVTPAQPVAVPAARVVPAAEARGPSARRPTGPAVSTATVLPASPVTDTRTSRPATLPSTAVTAARSILGARGRRAHRAVPAPGTAQAVPAGPAGPAGPAAPGPGAGPERDPLQGYLDAYREHLTRELLLEPLVDSGSAADFVWVPEATGDGGVAVGGTVPGTLSDQVVLRMAEHALARLGERSPQSAGTSLAGPEPDGDLLVQRWAVGPSGGFVLTVAARTGQGRRPTQVLIHFAAATGRQIASMPDPTPSPPGGVTALRPPYEIPRAGPAVDEARNLLILPLWWHSAQARCDGNDVILYEMPFRGQRLRVRANDYPAEPMYTLLVGEPGAEVAAVDVENWPSPWVRPRAF